MSTKSYLKKCRLRAGLAVVIAAMGQVMPAVCAEPAETEPPATQSVGGKFYEDRGRGYYWYETAPEPKKAAKPKPAAPLPPKVAATSPPATTEKPAPVALKAGLPEGPAPFSVKWIQQNLPKLHERAIDNPTKENVRAYYVAQRVMMDKAQEFARVSQVVVPGDPLLDETIRFPLAAGARAAVMRASEAKMDAYMRKLGKRAGLWVFHDPTCSTCVEQIPAINVYARRYQFPVDYILVKRGETKSIPSEFRMKFDNGQAKRLGIKQTPAVVLVVPPKDFIILSQGAVTFEDLKQRTVMLGSEAGVIPKDVYEEINPIDRGLITNDTLGQMPTGLNEDDPAAWVKQLETLLGAGRRGGESDDAAKN